MRSTIIVTVAALVVGALLGVGAAELTDSDSNLTEVRQVAYARGVSAARSAATREADERYRAGMGEGLQAGRDEFEQGTDGYRRIWRRGYGRARQKYEVRVASTPQVNSGTYESGHVDGYNEGYDEGYGHASAGDPYDNSDNDTPGTVGDDDAGSLNADEPEVPRGDADEPLVPQAPDAGDRDLDCADVGSNIPVGPDDPHGLDADGDGVGCEN